MRRYLAGLVAALFATMLAVAPQAVAPQQADAAEDYGVTIGGEKITSEHKAGDGWSYDSGSSTLRVKDWNSGDRGTAVEPPENGRYLGAKSYRAAITSLKRDLIIEVDKVSLGKSGWSESSNVSDPGASGATTAYFGIYAPDRKVTIRGTGSQAGPDLTIESHTDAIYCGELLVDRASVECTSHGTAVMVEKNTSKDITFELRNGSTFTAVSKYGRSINCDPEEAPSGQAQQKLVNYDGAAIFVAAGGIWVYGSTLSGETTYRERATSWGTTKGTPFGCAGIFAAGKIMSEGTVTTVRGTVFDKGINRSDALAHYGLLASSYYDIKDGADVEGTIQRAQGGGAWSFGIGESTSWCYQERAPQIYFYDGSDHLSDRGAVRSTLRRTSADPNATPKLGSLMYEDPYTLTSTTSTSGADVTLEARCTRSKGIYLRDHEGSMQWSWQREFHDVHEISGDVRGIFQFGDVVADETFKKRWRADEGTPDLHILSGDWTVRPGADSTANYYIEGGNVVVEAEDGKSYGGGHVYLSPSSTLTVTGDGIWGFWNVMPPLLGTKGGTVRFEGGTVRQASGDLNNRVEILGGNINLSRRDTQLVYDGQGNKLVRRAYDMAECPGTLKEIRIKNIANGGVSRLVDLKGFYPVDGKFCLWTKSNDSNNGENLGSVTMQDAGGYEYSPTIEGPDPDSGVYTLEPPAELRVFTPKASGTFYRDLGKSITLVAGTFGKAQSMDDKRIEWSYTDAREDTGKPHAIDCNDLSYTIDELSDDDEWRTYTCRVYRGAVGGEDLLGTYEARVHVVKWATVQAKVPGAVGQDATLTAKTAARSGNWLDGANSCWEVDKGDGKGWQEIEGAKGDSYTFKVENEGVQDWKFRRHIDQRIIVAIGKAGDSRFESTSPEIQVTFAPVIVTQGGEEEPATGGEASEPEPAEKPDAKPGAKSAAEQTPAKVYDKRVFSTIAFSKGKLTITWNRVQGAAGYEVYASERGSKGKLTAKRFLAKTIKGAAATKASVKKVAGKKLKESGDYQVTVRAFKLVKGKKRYLTSSPTVHAVSSAHAKYTSVKKVKTSSKGVFLKAGKSKKVKAKLVKKSASKKLASAKVRWCSTDPLVAKVSSTGKIAAKKAGTCKVYAMASNGVKATINVIVR